ncbi:MAG: right-handed parallel beta-helix repeat-containing protein [Cyclobacteriaceae bacterium]
MLTFLLIIVRCANDEFLIEPVNESYSGDLNTTTLSETGLTDCLSCTFVVPADMYVVDGAVLGLQPGSVIGLNANITYMGLRFRNIIGTADNPIIIKNCGGTVQIDGTGKHDALRTEFSKHFRITGGDVDGSYGIVVSGARMGINNGGLSTDFGVDHVKIINSGFAGIMSKTDPDCNPSTWRENFLMENVKLHHNYISDTGGEGIYAGNSFFSGANTACGVKLPHEIHNIEIYSNILKNTGWDAIQLGCATQGASIHGNTIENYGAANELWQNSGIQISAGTGGLCYSNLIRKGTGTGIGVFGIGDNIIYNNIIDQPGAVGIFCDERSTPGEGFKFLNNTILNPASDGILIFSELVPMNVFVNNIISNPGTGVFVSKLNDDVKITMANNYFTASTDSLQIFNLQVADYRLESTSPVIDKGGDVSAYWSILKDFYNHLRVSGAACDIGAIETAAVLNMSPVANAGSDMRLILPVTQIDLKGTATDADGFIVSYKWVQYGGEKVFISNANSETATIDGLKEGKYYFRLIAEDDDGATDYDNMLIVVTAPPVSQHNEDPIQENIAPVAYAGSDMDVELPENDIKLYGSGSDSDGSIVEYTWTQYGGPNAAMTDTNQPTATITFSESGKYYFRLTVKDDDGATDYDNILVRVTGSLSFINQEPVANAGPDRTLTLPDNSVTLSGAGTDSDGAVVTYSWIQYGGPAAIISNKDTATPTISVLVEGSHYFRLTVTDNKGATDYDNVLVRVNSPL